MEYIVLAFSEMQKTYERSNSLYEAYIDAERLVCNGWKIESILNIENKEDYLVPFESLTDSIKYLCKQFKKEIEGKDISQEKKEQTIALCMLMLLKDKHLKVDEAIDYAEEKIIELLEWNDLSEVISDYVKEQLKNYYVL